MLRIVVLSVLLALSLSGAASAQLFDEVRAGVYAQGCCIGSTKEQGAAINGEALFDSPRFLSVLGAPRPLIGATIATDSDATSQVYAGLEWKVGLGRRWFVAASGGGAVHNGETDRYDPVADADRVNHTVFHGCRALFRIAGDVGYRLTDRISASFHWNHISNGGLCGENEGLDQIGGRIGLSF